ncbi:hypothetical protein [Aldersonia kunmingensis]|uniref:hypothetical protein n=1 Tax=Aldersonia kunmingensis TaxID=408066 RepID=UPI00082EFA7C|nr:hypothetical protein [Aldersonia kunmingensis]
MAILHDSNNSSIAITTRLSGPRLAEISEFVAETGEFNGTAVRFDGFDGSHPTFSVHSVDDSVNDLTFHVTIASLGAMSTGYIEIDRTPGRFGGLAQAYTAYAQFVQRFGDIVRTEDPAARVSVT